MEVELIEVSFQKTVEGLGSEPKIYGRNIK